MGLEDRSDSGDHLGLEDRSGSVMDLEDPDLVMGLAGHSDFLEDRLSAALQAGL